MVSFIATLFVAIGVILVLGGFAYWLWYEYKLYRLFKKIRKQDKLDSE